MNQFGFNNVANVGTYNDVAGNLINNYNSNDPELASNMQEQADILTIRTLKIAENPSGNQHQTCIADTRVQILQDIRRWAEDTTTTNQIFWLADQAGTGKSTVAKQIADDWDRAAKPFASFFFSINAADTKSNSKFCPTIAAMLAKLPDFGPFRSTLAEALRQNLTVETCGFVKQFEELLFAPLKKTKQPTLIIIDALDECNEKDRDELLLVLFDKLNQLPMVKVVITSRPEPDIVELLQTREMVCASNLRGSDDVDSSIHDVSQYVMHFFTNSPKLRRVQSYAPKVASAANGLFIYATTACKYLEKSFNFNAALKTLERISGLDDLYLQIMERATPQSDPGSLQAMSFILQIILAAQRPLSITEMRGLLKEEDLDIPSIVAALASVLSSGAEDRPVEILHPTFQQYLTDRGRSGTYFIDLKQGHKALAIGCLEACSETAITFPKGASEDIYPMLGYAALYWVIHAAAFFREVNAQGDIESLNDRIVAFFKKDLIRWFQLIVLLDAVYQSAKNLVTLETSYAIGPITAIGPISKISECVRWCQEAQRFLQHHQAGIEQGYIHVLGAISFTPKESLIYKMYFGTFAQQIPVVLSGIPVNWPSHRILSGHRNSVLCVAFSPDGTRVVSCSGDNTLRLWDGVTGASISGPMNGHTDSVTSVAFSPDGTRIVSGSSDNTLRLWDGVTGASIGGPMSGHTSRVNSVAFSPDDTRVVSGSLDETLRLWDAATGASIGGPMNGHTREVKSVTFSPDGIRVISGSDDHNLRLWDGATGASIGGPINGHTGSVYSVAFSPDGTRVVSGSSDNTVRLWDGVTGAPIGGAMIGHTGGVYHVTFSPDGTRVASGSGDGNLRLWDGMTGASVGTPMYGHALQVTSVAFSPDGTRIVSGSGDHTLRLWDGVTGASIGGPTHGHTWMVTSVAFSPDGTRVVSGSLDKTLRLWDGLTSASIDGPMNRHAGHVICVAFSPDGIRVVSGSSDRSLQLWDGVTGARIGRHMIGHVGSIHYVAFSPDGTRIISVSGDSTLRLWDVPSGAEVAVIHNHFDIFAKKVGFSTCGSYIIYNFRAWDIRSIPPSPVHGVTPEVLTQPSSPVRYNHETRMIEIYIPPVFSFPVSGCQVANWVAHRGRIALGLEDGRVMIINCTHLL